MNVIYIDDEASIEEQSLTLELIAVGADEVVLDEWMDENGCLDWSIDLPALDS